jgi:hypothetical protein
MRVEKEYTLCRGFIIQILEDGLVLTFAFDRRWKVPERSKNPELVAGWKY